MNLHLEFERELRNNILPFWSETMADPRGGFFGRMDGNGAIMPDEPKGGILNSRILWTFASAYRTTGLPYCLESARRAKSEILDKFVDREFGGIYWSINADGTPCDTKKQFYAIAFAVYGLAELYRAAGDEDALQAAIELYRSIEEHSFDAQKGGYIEACTREWGAIEDMRLSEKDQNDAKTMNTHLHILEGYTGLYRVWKDETLAERLRGLILIFLDRITGPDGHLQLFFDEEWNLHGNIQSYGHDIEASWLLNEAAEVLGDVDLLSRTREVCAKIAQASTEGLAGNGALTYEWDIANGHRDGDFHWWVQAENVVGCYNQYQLTGEELWLDRAMAAWKFIKDNLVCPDGEWYWSLRADGSVNRDDDRAGFWKCPYHNGRMCMEMMERTK